MTIRTPIGPPCRVQISDEALQGAGGTSIVLLKNNQSVLPLTPSSIKTIALIGPSANVTDTFLGNYYGYPPYIRTVLQGLEKFSIPNIVYVPGCSIAENDTSGFAAAIAAAAKADLTIYVGGLNQTQESEGNDRTIISLPGVQWQLVQQLEQATKNPIVFVLVSGGQVDLTYARDSPSINAIVWAGYPGQAGGDAIASVLFGTYNPAGRLPVTQYPTDYINGFSMFDMNFRPAPEPNVTPGRTYRFFTGTPVFPFGFGLSYTTFLYVWETSGAQESPVVFAVEKISAMNSDRVEVIPYRVQVTNTGSRPSDEVVLAFMSFTLDSSFEIDTAESGLTVSDLEQFKSDAPIRQLIGFERIFLCVECMKEVFFGISVRNILSVKRDGSHWLLPGTYTLRVGTGENEVTKTFRLEGKPMMWAERAARSVESEMREKVIMQ